MVEQVKRILLGQLEGALCMLEECIRVCPREHWAVSPARRTVRPRQPGAGGA